MNISEIHLPLYNLSELFVLIVVYVMRTFFYLWKIKTALFSLHLYTESLRKRVSAAEN